MRNIVAQSREELEVLRERCFEIIDKLQEDEAYEDVDPDLWEMLWRHTDSYEILIEDLIDALDEALTN